MIRKSWQEIADRAVWMLALRGVPAKEIMRCCEISEYGLKQAIKRVEAGRYGQVTPTPIQAGEGR